ncbi:MAG: PA14 domain-containing protein [Anaerolineae bacterium]
MLDLFLHSARRWGAAVLFAALAMLLLGQQTASADCIPGNQVDKSAFFAEVARQLRNPSVPESATDFAVRAFLAWEPYENTAACWNPLATTLRYTDPACSSWNLPGNRAGVQQYPSQECGIRATADTLNYTFNGNGLAYQNIRRMMAKQGFDEAALLQELRRWVGSEGYARAVVSQWRELYYSGGGSGPAGYTFCAWEGERCSFSGAADVAYGANGQFAHRQSVSGGIDCNNDVFGDPIFGVHKACFVKPISAGPAQCPGQYRAEYFANPNLSGSPALVRCEGWPIRHDWGGGSPGSGVPDDGFSARWSGRARIEEGSYTFIAQADDGIRVWLDGGLILDAWRDQPLTEYRVTRDVSAGEHEVQVEYYENGGGALAEFRWERAGVSDQCPGTPISLEQRVEGRLSDGAPSATYCLRASAGQVISARMFALGNDGLDPYLQVLTADGRRLAENDDGLNIGYNAFLSVRIPQDGVYRIEATRYDGEGRYALRVERGFEAAVGDLDRDCDVDSGDRDRLRSLLGSTDPDADLDLDGAVSTRDAIFQMRSLGVRCR